MDAIIRQQLKSYILDKTRGIVRMDDDGLQAIIDIVRNEGKAGGWQDIRFERYDFNTSNWKFIRELKVHTSRVNHVLLHTDLKRTFASYRYNLPDGNIIYSDDNCLFDDDKPVPLHCWHSAFKK